MMKALVYNGPQRKAWQDVASPSIQDSTDAIVLRRLTARRSVARISYILKGRCSRSDRGPVSWATRPSAPSRQSAPL